jgi:hypothetical protein
MIVRPMAFIPALVLLVLAALPGGPALADDDLRQARPGDPLILNNLAWRLRDRDPVLALSYAEPESRLILLELVNKPFPQQQAAQALLNAIDG